jgi:hypothetical protein
VNRGAEFLRSVFPVDTGQLLFLFGVVSLYISPLLPWTPLTKSLLAKLTVRPLDLVFSLPNYEK